MRLKQLTLSFIRLKMQSWKQKSWHQQPALAFNKDHLSFIVKAKLKITSPPLTVEIITLNGLPNQER